MLYFACPWLSDRDVCQICALSRFTPRFSDVLLGSNRGAMEHQSSKHGVPQGGQAKTLESRRRHRRAVVRAQLRLWFLELPDSPPDQDCGNSEMSDSNDSYLGANTLTRSTTMREKYCQRAPTTRMSSPLGRKSGTRYRRRDCLCLSGLIPPLHERRFFWFLKGALWFFCACWKIFQYADSQQLLMS